MNRVLLGLLGVLSLAIGILLLAVNPQISQSQFAILGAVAVLVGVLAISTDEKSWPVCFVTIATGFYFLARAGGYVEYDWLRLTAGVLGLAAGFAIILNILLPESKNRR